MKRSNILIITYAACIMALMLAAFIITKLQYDRDAINQNRKTIALNDFSVIVGHNHARFFVEKGDENKIVVNYLKEENIPSDLFSVRNDTLFVHKNMYGYNGRARVCCKDIHSIKAIEKSCIDIEDLALDRINLEMQDANINFSNRNVPPDHRIDMHIQATKGHMRADYTHINILDVFADNSHLSFFQGNTFQHVTAELVNGSELRLNRTPEHRPAIKKDQKSFYFSSEEE